MCAKSKMEPEKRGSREQGVQGNLSQDTLTTHTLTHGGVQRVLTERKYKGTTPAWEQRIQVKWPRDTGTDGLSHTDTHTHTTSLRIHKEGPGRLSEPPLETGQLRYSHPAECWLNRGADANRSANEHRSKDLERRGPGRGDWAPASHSVSHTPAGKELSRKSLDEGKQPPPTAGTPRVE